MRTRVLVMTFALMAVSSLAEAAGYFSATAQSTLVQVPGPGASVLFLNLNGTITATPPACATQNYRFVVNSANAAAAAQIAQILSAVARGAMVWIQGSGACDVWGDTETILWIQTL